ncbi:glycosyltransferase [Methylibium sp.]|uniref:glycosyltransferase n=1 Tax=Methylibium sp. TaxID=2067992 RepID=UPI003D0F612F
MYPSPSSATAETTQERPLILVSHGYENIYERGFCNGLSDAGIPFTLISSDRTDYAGLRQGTKTVNLRGSQEESRGKWQKLLNLVQYHLRLMWYALAHRNAVVHVIGLIEPPLLCGVIEGLWFRLVTRRYVLTVHDLLPHDRWTRMNQMLFGLTFRIAERLVVHTERMRDELMERHGINASRIVVMEHGLEPLQRSVSVLEAYTPDAPFKILFFGKVMRYKGIDLLLNALADFPHPFSLRIAGVCRDASLISELTDQIAAHPQRTSIDWPNEYVHEAEIEPLFTGSHVLAMPYRHIDQSGVLFQALRFGLPIVATKVGALRNYVDQKVGETCEPMSSHEIRDALLRLVDRYGRIDRRSIMESGRCFEWQHSVKVLPVVYAS